jgi:hypothetical protein
VTGVGKRYPRSYRAIGHLQSDETAEFQNGKNTPTPPVFSQEWQAKELEDTELGSMYGRWEGSKTSPTVENFAEGERLLA